MKKTDPNEQDSQEGNLDQVKILLVDDHQMVLEMLQSFLSRFVDPKNISLAKSAREAEAAIQESRPELVLLDLCLPDSDGIGVAQRIHDEYPEIRVLILTALVDPDSVVRALDAGASGYLLKTCPTSELLTAIQTISRGGYYLCEETTRAMRPKLSDCLVTNQETVTWR